MTLPPKPKPSFYRLLSPAASTITALFGGFWQWSPIQRSTETLDISHHTLVIPGLPAAFDGLTLTHLSDLHASTLVRLEFLQSAIAQAQQLASDLIVITGDLVYSDGPDYTPHLTALLAPLTAPLGVYAIYGNHDHQRSLPAIAAALKQANVTLLYNTALPLHRNGHTLYLAGVDDPREGRPLLANALRTVPPDGFVILLAHAPDFADIAAQDTRIRLQLSGHSHGGQIRLPLIGPLYLPTMGRKYVMGRFQLGHLTLYVNRGLGVSGIPLRLNCRPEISIFTLRTAR